MGEQMTNHNLTAENLARRIRVQLAEFNDDNLSVQALVKLLVDFRRDAQRTIAHLTQPAQAVDVDEPQVFQDLRYWMKHCVSACDEGEDFSLTRDDLIALTTLGLMEKAGRGKWRPTDKGRALAALPNANGKEG